MPESPASRHSAHRHFVIDRRANCTDWHTGQRCSYRSVAENFLFEDRGAFPSLLRTRGVKPTASTKLRHSAPCGAGAVPKRCRTATWATSWQSTSASRSGSPSFKSARSDTRPLAGLQRPRDCFRRVLKVTCSEEARSGSCHSSPHCCMSERISGSTFLSRGADSAGAEAGKLKIARSQGQGE